MRPLFRQAGLAAVTAALILSGAGTGHAQPASENPTSLEPALDTARLAAAPGILKICKVGGTGIPVGTPFSFNISPSTSHAVLSVPAGPPPGGTCMVGPSYPVGTQVADHAGA